MTLVETFIALVVLCGGAVVAIWRVYTRGRTSGREDVWTETIRDAGKRTDAGRDAVQDGRSSGDTPDERLRNNDSSW